MECESEVEPATSTSVCSSQSTVSEQLNAENIDTLSWDVLLLLRINNVYKNINPRQIIRIIQHYHRNPTTCISTLSRMKARFTKCGFDQNWIDALILPPAVYKRVRTLRKRRMREQCTQSFRMHPRMKNDEDHLKDAVDSSITNESMGMIPRSGASHTVYQHDPESQTATVPNSLLAEDEPIHSISISNPRVTILWVNRMSGIPEMFKQAYVILSRRRLLSGRHASAQHVYAALNLLTGLQPDVLLCKTTVLDHKTTRTHAGNFAKFWASVQCRKKDRSGSVGENARAHEALSTFDRPFLAPAHAIIRAYNWLKQVLFRENTRVPSNLNVWARRSLQLTFSPFCKCDRYSATNERRQPEYRNPDHRINKVLYLYGIKMNYFQGFSTQDVAKYLHMKGSYEGIRPKFTPMVHTLAHTAFKSP